MRLPARRRLLLRRSLTLVVGVAAALVSVAAAAQGSLAMYCSSPNTAWCQGMATGFERATGAKVSVTQKATGELFAQINMPLKATELEDVLVHFGGPVQTDRGFVLHDAGGPWQSTLQVNENIGLTTSRDILQAVGEGVGPQHLLVTLGYAGWSEGQLEQELADNAWLSVLASEHILFELPAEERLPAAMALLGIDFASLSDEAGHA